MKTTILLFVMIFGCVISTYSQMNSNHKADIATKGISFYPNRKSDYFSDIKLATKFSNSFNKSAFNNLTISKIQSEPVKNTEETYSGDNMPCFKPQGVFSMRVLKPDSTVTYTMLLKKY